MLHCLLIQSKAIFTWVYEKYDYMMYNENKNICQSKIKNVVQTNNKCFNINSVFFK